MSNYKGSVKMKFEVTDSLENANLSVRTHNCLRRAGIETIEDLLAHDRQEIPNIKNLGKKSIHEVYNLLDFCERKFFGRNRPVVNEPFKFQKDSNGLHRVDILLDEIKLPRGSSSPLRRAGYEFVSDIIKSPEEKIIAVLNMNKAVAADLFSEIEKLHFKASMQIPSNTVINSACRKFVLETAQSLDIHDFYLYQILFPIFERNNNPELEELYDIGYLRDAVKRKVLSILADALFEIETKKVEEQFQEKGLSSLIFQRILVEMNDTGMILIKDGRVKRNFLSLFDLMTENPRFSLREVVVPKQFFSGKSYNQIAEDFRVTKIRIRQVMHRAMNKINVRVAEDYYRDFYKKYDFSLEQFCFIFDVEPVAYRYLKFSYPSKRNFKKLSLQEFYDQELLPFEVKKRTKEQLSDVYFKSKKDVADYILRTHFQDEGSYADFESHYVKFLDSLNLTSGKVLELSDRYSTSLTLANNILWKHGKKLRYFDMSDLNFSTFSKAMRFDKYSNTVISTFDLFEQYPDLMQYYDIRDRYELHNLLKKLAKRDGVLDINFKRMPFIMFESNA